MNIADLRTFAAIARAGSFAAHARDTGIDPSSVSRVIGALEARLGFRLFDRTTRRLALTQAGQLYLERIVPLLDEFERAADLARDTVSEPSGLLRITASVAFGERWLMPRIATFRSRHPTIRVDAHLTDEVVDIVAERIDVSLRLGPGIRGDFVAAKLFDTHYRIVASPAYLQRNGHLAGPDDLARHDAIAFPLPGYRSRWLLRDGTGTVREVRPRIALTVSNALAIRRAALEGLGVALLAEWTVAEDLARGTLVDALPGHEASAADFDTAAWVLYPGRATITARMRAFISHIRDAR